MARWPIPSCYGVGRPLPVPWSSYVRRCVRIERGGHLEREGALRNQPGPFGAIFSPTNHDQLLVTLSGVDVGPPAPGVASFSLTGAARAISVLTDAALEDPCWLAITPDGRYLWASAFLPRSLTLYSVDKQGHLTQHSSNISEGGPGSTDIALDSSGRFLYQLRAFDVVAGADGVITPQIAVLEVTGRTENGGLRPVQLLTLSEDLGSAGVMGMLVIDHD